MHFNCDSKEFALIHPDVRARLIVPPLVALNGIRDDNRIENLELWHRGQPPGQRVKDKIDWAIEFLSGYGYKIIKI